jgi:hypothetical protein
MAQRESAAATLGSSPAFERMAGAAAIGVAVGTLLYSVLFISLVEGADEWENELWFFTLMVGALATVPVFVAVYLRLRERDPGLALTAFVLALGGSLGGVLHGGYELGALVTPQPTGYTPGPEAVSHGVLRYAVAGIALLLMAFLIQRGGRLPRSLAVLGYVGGVLLVVIYAGRLYDFIQPGDYASLIPPILYGFVVGPLWNLMLGLTLWRGRSPAA